MQSLEAIGDPLPALEALPSATRSGPAVRPTVGGILGRGAATQDEGTLRNAAPALGSGGAYLHAGRRGLALVLGALALAPALALALPIVVALAFVHGPGRVLFRQPRVGRDGRVFLIWKFRTMRDGPTEGAAAFERWSRGDAEVTGLGRWLRDTHLDELPQLVNVLLGDMDLVGPRPEMVEVHRWASDSVPGFHRRNAARPGLTGLAQLEHGYAGKDVLAYRAKLDADLRYLAKANLVGDLGLLARTARTLLRRA